MAQGSALTRNDIPYGSNNGFREQYYTNTRDISVSGKIAGNIKVRLYIFLRWLFNNISGSMYSFRLASCVVQDIISVLPWIAAGSSRKSMWERLRENKVSEHDRKWQISCLEGVREGKVDGSEARGLRWRAMLWIPHGSKNLFHRAILYRHEKMICVKEDCRQYPAETMYTFVMVFHQYLRIH